MRLSEFLKQMRFDAKYGPSLWCLLANKRVFWNGKEIQTGTFRWNAGEIADATGCDYYECYLSHDSFYRDEILKIFAENNVILRDKRGPEYDNDVYD